MRHIDNIYYPGLALIGVVILSLGACGREDSADIPAADTLQTSITDAATATGEKDANVESDKD